MRQALHIFRKDLRFLWPFEAATLATSAAFCWALLSAPEGRPTFFEAGSPILPFLSRLLAWCAFAAASVYKERPCGEQQFWITRPYRWKSLLAAKAMLLLVFINLPALFSDLAVVLARGAPLSVTALVFRQLTITAYLIAPTVALATVTSSWPQMALTGVAAAIALIVSPFASPFASEPWGNLESLHELAVTALTLVGCLSVAAWQYTRRRTTAARCFLFAVIVVSFGAAVTPATDAAVTLATLKPEPAAVRAIYLCPGAADGLDTCADGRQPFDGPLRLLVAGLQRDSRIEGDLFKIEMHSFDRTWSSGWTGGLENLRTGITWTHSPNSFDIQVGDPAIELLNSKPVDIRMSVVMSVYRQEETRFAQLGIPLMIPGSGACRLEDRDAPRLREFPTPRVREIQCVGMFLPSLRPSTESGTLVSDGPYYYQPNPVFENTIPIRKTDPDAAVNRPRPITGERLIARIRRDTEIRNVGHLRSK
jgi:hypothetical protein